MKIFTIVTTAFMLILTSGCSIFFSTLEFNDIVDPHVILTTNKIGPILQISGECSHTGYVIEKVVQIKDGRTLSVLVKISPFARDKHSQKFDTEVYVDDFDFVIFGETRKLLWRRYPNTTPDAPQKPVFVPEKPRDRLKESDKTETET